MSDVLNELFSLPLLPLKIGAELLQRSVAGLGEAVEGAGKAPSRQSADLRPAAPERPAPGWAPAWEPPATGPSRPLNRPPHAAGGPPGANVRPPSKEDRQMSCNCCGSDYCSCESNVSCSPVTGDRGLGGRC
jgi:hypothetical protein